MNFFYTGNNKAVVLWFSGLSGSGKTTIALSLKDVLVEKGKKVDILDGDVVRGLLNRHLGFSRNDIRKNNMSIAKLASKRLADFDLILVITHIEELKEAFPVRIDVTKTDQVGSRFELTWA